MSLFRRKPIRSVRITAKGRALLIAIETGLLPKDENGEIELNQFNLFWERMLPMLRAYGFKD